MDYWKAVKAAIYWCHQGGCAYVVRYKAGHFGVVLGDDSPQLHYPDHRVCLRVGR